MDDQPAAFGGNTALGLLSLVVLGPVAIVGAALVVIGLLAVWGVEVGPLREGDVPEWLDLLYGGSNGFKSFVACLLGGVAAVGSATVIKWCFTGQWIKGSW
jgi:hypothetical protein